MSYFIIGLGNPGEEYKESRHNAGRMAVSLFTPNKKVTIIDSKEFMNNSGRAVAKFVKSKKAAEKLIVVYDDLDLPLGAVKISYDKSSGGHNGLESVIKAVKTKEFTRIRIGVSPKKKPQGEEKVLKFILSKFTPAEQPIIKKSLKRAAEAIKTIIENGREIAMNQVN
jgi:peptidyl-tRNA hydrolase, PTH1 family